MDTLFQILSQPFIWGLGLGLLIAGFLWKSGWTARSVLKAEVKRLDESQRELQSHLNTHLKISATGNDQLQRELQTLKEQNENLRVNLQGLQQKPGRPEIRQWQIMEFAVARMREQAPGFAPAWEQAMRAATADLEASESGFTKLLRKVLPSSPASGRVEESETISLMPSASKLPNADG